MPADDKPRAFDCPSEDCPGNLWHTIRTVQIPLEKGGGVRRLRQCMICEAVIETIECESFPDAVQRPLPLAAYFQRR